MKNRNLRSRRRNYFNFGVIAVLCLMAVVLTAGQIPWRHKTCTVTGFGTNAFTSSKGQDWKYAETSCGELGSYRWVGRGSSAMDSLEVGKTYEFGLNGFSFLWTRPNIITWEEISQ